MSRPTIANGYKKGEIYRLEGAHEDIRYGGHQLHRILSVLLKFHYTVQFRTVLELLEIVGSVLLLPRPIFSCYVSLCIFMDRFLSFDMIGILCHTKLIPAMDSSGMGLAHRR